MIATIKFLSNKMLLLIAANFKIEKNCYFLLLNVLLILVSTNFPFSEKKIAKASVKGMTFFRENSNLPEGEILLWLN